jgi:hypothetical protein
MGKFRCICDNVISTSGQNPNGWLIIPELEFEDAWDAGKEFADVHQQMRSMFVCPNCGRIWVFWEGLGKRGTPYSPEPAVDPVQGPPV